MRCDRCKNNEATVFLNTCVEGSPEASTSENLCQQCADAEGTLKLPDFSHVMNCENCGKSLSAGRYQPEDEFFRAAHPPLCPRCGAEMDRYMKQHVPGIIHAGPEKVSAFMRGLQEHMKRFGAEDNPQAKG